MSVFVGQWENMGIGNFVIKFRISQFVLTLFFFFWKKLDRRLKTGCDSQS
jgi:hypothetical protein